MTRPPLKQHASWFIHASRHRRSYSLSPGILTLDVCCREETIPLILDSGRNIEIAVVEHATRTPLHSTFSSSSTIRETLRLRLINVIERGFIAREGQSAYVITQKGIDYAAPAAKAKTDPKRDMLQAITAFNDSQRKAFRERLSKMHPYRFEHLVRELLEAMGYDDVQVTKASGDKGIDVVATVQFGITTITEVVQVKRHQGNVGRPVLDQLRGALPYFKAIRGTIITLGNFTNECKQMALFPGSPPTRPPPHRCRVLAVMVVGQQAQHQERN